jgi:hypothetical protein
LRVHHWLECARPVTFVLTDGSGHSDHSRIDSTTQVLARAGATRGAIYGALTDRALYQAILRGNHTIFAQLAQDLAAALQRERVTCVVGDAAEGVNPGHDVCRLLINAALALIARMSGRRITNMEFPVEGPPGECPPEDRAQAVLLDLDDAAYARKLAAARAYPELVAELERVSSASARCATASTLQRSSLIRASTSATARRESPQASTATSCASATSRRSRPASPS